jgi:hypothetical protein
MADLISIVWDEGDVIAQAIDHIISEWIVGDKQDAKESLIANKIWDHIEMFCEGNMIADGHRVSVCSWPIHEFRIAIPKSSYLLRIFFGCEKWKIVLLTWYLIKPNWYNDKWTKKSIDRIYQQKIKEAQTIRLDYKLGKKRRNTYAILKD